MGTIQQFSSGVCHAGHVWHAGHAGAHAMQMLSVHTVAMLLATEMSYKQVRYSSVQTTHSSFVGKHHADPDLHCKLKHPASTMHAPCTPASPATEPCLKCFSHSLVTFVCDLVVCIVVGVSSFLAVGPGVGVPKESGFDLVGAGVLNPGVGGFCAKLPRDVRRCSVVDILECYQYRAGYKFCC